MQLFHGTGINHATSIVTGPPHSIDVTLGGGELGRGFYLGNSYGMAVIWAKGKFGSNARVLKFHIEESHFMQLDGKVIKKRTKVYELWQDLIKAGSSNQFTFEADYILAPFATSDIGEQFKFESYKAEAVLNASKIVIL